MLLPERDLRKRGNHPFGHPPNGSLPRMVGRESPGNPTDLQVYASIIRGVEETVEGKPERAGDFSIENQDGGTGDGKHEGSGEDRWASAGARSDVIQLAEQLAGIQDQADFFPGFTNRGGEQVGISAGPPAAGQPHVAGPWVAFPLRPPDDQHRIRLVSQDQGHRGFVDLGILDYRRGPAGEPGLDKSVEGTQ